MTAACSGAGCRRFTRHQPLGLAGRTSDNWAVCYFSTLVGERKLVCAGVHVCEITSVELLRSSGSQANRTFTI